MHGPGAAHKRMHMPKIQDQDLIGTIVAIIALSGASLFQCGLEKSLKASNSLSAMLWLVRGFATHSLTVRI